MTVIKDPTGGVIAACERTTGAQLVNEFGAWAMSSLSTPDPDAAAAFYGAVFGWTTETFEMGDDQRHDVPPARLRGRRAASSPSAARSWRR